MGARNEVGEPCFPLRFRRIASLSADESRKKQKEVEERGSELREWIDGYMAPLAIRAASATSASSVGTPVSPASLQDLWIYMTKTSAYKDTIFSDKNLVHHESGIVYAPAAGRKSLHTTNVTLTDHIRKKNGTA
jgi:hypothetical protein